MRIFNKFRGTKGFIVTWERVLRFRYMISDTAKERCRILAFWEKHGTEATCEAFQVSRATLFRWQKALDQGHGKLEALNKQSTAPKRRRKRLIQQSVQDLIIKERQQDHRIGKEKLATLLAQDGIATFSASTVGRMLHDLKQQGVLPDQRPLSFYGKDGVHREKTLVRRKKLRSSNHEGSLAKADTVVRFVDGMKRYILTAIDVESKFAFALAYKNHSSDPAAHFMALFRTIAPVPLTHVQTDNGSEFAKHFDVFLEQSGIVHFHTYPRSPKQNAEIERFNRTLSDAFIKHHRMLLAYDIDAFNDALMGWLLWYNTRRPHWSLGLISPLRYICDQVSEKESQMLWTSTNF